jgi:hypothetical protein
LKRGEKIVLPTAAEIAKFREANKVDPSAVIKKLETTINGVPSNGSATTTGNGHGATTDAMDIVCKPCPQCNRLTTMSATICPACAFPFEGQKPVSERITEELPDGTAPMIADSTRKISKPESNAQPQPPEQDAADDATTSLLIAAGRTQIAHTPEADRGIRNVIAPITETCRIVSFGNMDDSGVGFRTRLEVRQEEFWLPVVRYEINDDASWRHTFNLSGTRKTTRIDLPSRAAKEMAEHDLSMNAEKYAKAFLEGRDVNDVV